jgi:Uncharacterized protein conserved in bacteria (DUF2252)
MNVVKSTRRYEDWMSLHTHVVEADLRLKHQQMAASVFMFLRATFYRWAQVWPEVCPDLANAPEVLAVGDLHVENFGTWRDIEGRLVWGVNDFDEAYPISYANDLVRLAVSTHLAIAENHLSLRGKGACEAIFQGYVDSLKQGGRPFVLGEHNQWLRAIAESELRDPVRFWKKMDSLTPVRSAVPVSASEALEHLMPEKHLPCKIVHRIAGLGSLGRQRYVALAQWRGGRIAREAKALLPSACHWAANKTDATDILYNAIIARAVRCSDPFVQLQGHWIVRRLSPHCSRIELSTLPVQRDELKLLYAMGWETANVHLGSRGAEREILRHLGKQPAGWLHAASRKMAKAVEKDFSDWKKAETN